uniref:Putative secreted protein n=1 Tax=Anopheles darlingi TaxID=43151 RepID=A0A2M4DD13_ANODA
MFAPRSASLRLSLSLFCAAIPLSLNVFLVLPMHASLTNHIPRTWPMSHSGGGRLSISMTTDVVDDLFTSTRRPQCQ